MDPTSHIHLIRLVSQINRAHAVNQGRAFIEPPAHTHPGSRRSRFRAREHHDANVGLWLLDDAKTIHHLPAPLRLDFDTRRLLSAADTKAIPIADICGEPKTNLPARFKPFGSREHAEDFVLLAAGNRHRPTLTLAGA